MSFAGGGEGDIAIIEGVTPISLSNAAGMKEEGAVFFDVNPENIRNEVGFIPNAILLEDEDFIDALPTDQTIPIIVYGTNVADIIPSSVAVVLMEEGFEKVYVMIEGVEGWKISGREAIKISAHKWNKGIESDNYTDLVHGKLMFGEIPACRSCHAEEDGRINEDTAITNVLLNDNCADCHEKVAIAFDKSIHSNQSNYLLSKGVELYDNADSMTQEKKKPTCITCHSIHKGGEMREMMNRKQLAEAQCSECHEDEVEKYRNTFHGKGLLLTVNDDNLTRLPSCYDCHSAHSVQKSDNPHSTLFGFTAMQTCSADGCHSEVGPGFTTYISHPDKTDKEQNAVIYYVSWIFIILISTVFIAFGIHSILFIARMIIVRNRNPEAWKKAMHAMHHDKVAIRRFSLLHRLQHFFMGTSFLTLSITGLPQLFYDAPWAKTLATILGGPLMLTQIHHAAALVLIAVFFSHVIEVGAVAYKRRNEIRDPETGKMSFMRFLRALFGPESLLPRKKDIQDIGAQIKWFLGLGPRPQFDRWIYWEKFDYLAEIWGMFTFGITGLMLWFPEWFSTWMPGWAFNLATVIHSYEAVLAIGFIFAVHFINTHFRLDRFPMDMVIFSGTLTEEELKQERKVWYDRLVATDKLKDLKEENGKFDKYVNFSKTIGFIMVALGLFALALMVYAYFIA